MPAQVRVHLLTPQGIQQKRLQLDVGRGLRLDKLLDRLDKERVAEKGFFRKVRKGREGATLLLNGERLDPSDAGKTWVRDGDELTVMSPITGG